MKLQKHCTRFYNFLYHSTQQLSGMFLSIIWMICRA